MFMERRRKKRPVTWEVIDVELATVYYSGPDRKDADDYRQAIELIGHRAIVKEVK